MIKKLAKSIREYKKETILTPIFMILEVVMETLIPYLLAILIDDELQMLVECKSVKTKLNSNHLNQLLRYYSVSDCKIAVLTNGVEYWFFTDSIKAGRMDSNPFLIVDVVNDDLSILEHVDTNIRIFFSGENLHNPRHAQYADYMLSGKKPFDLALGFDYFEHENYLRFPLWLTYMFAPNATEEDIYKRCEELRFPKIDNKTRFASLIARYDWKS